MMRFGSLLLACTVGAAAWSGGGVARAQPWRVEVVPEGMEPTLHNFLRPVGFGLAGGVGWFDYTDGDLQARTEVGGTWTLRGILGTRSVLGAEVAYVGTGQDVDAIGLDRSTTMFGTGFEAVARAGLPIVRGDIRVTPLVFAGLGWNRFALVGDSFNLSSVQDDDGEVVIPVGIGGSIAFGNILFDARFTFRHVLDDEILTTGGETDRWALTLSGGYQF